MTCDHCGLALPPRPVAGRFCCPACQLVFEAIHEAGLEGYYLRRPEAPGRPAEEVRDGQFAYLNRPEVQERYACAAPGGLLEASLMLDGLHCAACAWLVERAVGSLPGVAEARVNFATSRLRVSFHPGGGRPGGAGPTAACLRGDGVGLGDLARQVARVGYRATPYDPAGQEEARNRSARDLLLRMGVAGCAAGNLMLIAAALYSGADLDTPYRGFFHLVSLALALPVLLFSAAPFLRGAWTGLRHGAFTMDGPIALGILVTFLYSLWATLTGKGEVYFDTMATFVFVLLVGRTLESSARGRVSGAVERLLSLGARTAVRVGEEGRREVAAEELVPGDRVEVAPGCTVPVDGVVLQGTAWVDESALTGESVPVSRGPGAWVTGGSVNRDGLLLVEARRTGSDTALARIARRVEEAGARQAPVQRLADRAARWFVAAVLALSLATFLLWLPGGLERAMMVAVSVLIITCPCALGLATPIAVAVASGRAASRGILFRGGDVLEAVRGLTHVVLDKTGTVTEGVLEVRRVLSPPGLAEEALRLAATAERHSVHPLARALGCLVEAENQAVSGRAEPGRPLRASGAPSDFEAWPGRGVTATVEGRRVRVGSLDFMPGGAPVDLLLQAEAAEEQGQTVVWLAVDGEVRAGFCLADRVRPEARGVVEWLRRQGLEVLLVSGDREAPVRSVARQLGVDGFHARVLPEGKEALVRDLQARGARVAVVGDGVNDAAALAAADVGVAVARGADVSTEAAGVVLLRPGLLPLVEALELARDTFATIQDNLRLSALYNLLAVPTAMAGWVAPVLAAVAMPLSSLLVIGNSLRLAGRRLRGLAVERPAPEPATGVPVAATAAGWR